jgi:hypothetical protein
MINLNTKLLSKGAKHITIRSIGSDGKLESKDSECILIKNSEENFENTNTSVNLASSSYSSNIDNLMSNNDKVCI